MDTPVPQGSPAAGAWQRPAALLWDVDGTLAETEHHGHREAFNRAFREAGLPWHWDSERYAGLLAISGGLERLRHFLRAAEGEEPPLDRLRALQASKQHHYGALVASGTIQLRPGVAELIAEARAAAVPQAIVTTSGRQAVAALLGSLPGDLAEGFAFWICGEDVERKKPDPEAYRLAVGRLGLAPERVLALEDSPQGLAAASAAGLTTLVTLSHYSAAEPPDRFSAAAAVVAQLAPPLGQRHGPACPQGRITLSYLGRLLAER